MCPPMPQAPLCLCPRPPAPSVPNKAAQLEPGPFLGGRWGGARGGGLGLGGAGMEEEEGAGERLGRRREGGGIRREEKRRDSWGRSRRRIGKKRTNRGRGGAEAAGIPLTVPSSRCPRAARRMWSPQPGLFPAGITGAVPAGAPRGSSKAIRPSAGDGAAAALGALGALAGSAGQSGHRTLPHHPPHPLLHPPPPPSLLSLPSGPVPLFVPLLPAGGAAMEPWQDTWGHGQRHVGQGQGHLGTRPVACHGQFLCHRAGDREDMASEM